MGIVMIRKAWDQSIAHYVPLIGEEEFDLRALFEPRFVPGTRRAVEIPGDRNVFGTGDATMTTRQQYVEKAKAKLDEWNAEIERLQAQAAQATRDAQDEMQRQLSELRRQRDDLTQRMRAAEEAGESAWNDLKAGLEQAFESLRQGFENARSRFRK